jgi:hypothetical protein
MTALPWSNIEAPPIATLRRLDTLWVGVNSNRPHAITPPLHLDQITIITHPRNKPQRIVDIHPTPMKPLPQRSGLSPCARASSQTPRTPTRFHTHHTHASPHPTCPISSIAAAVQQPHRPHPSSSAEIPPTAPISKPFAATSNRSSRHLRLGATSPVSFRPIRKPRHRPAANYRR